MPLTTAVQMPVVNDELAVIDTNRIDDGLYALRLTVNTADGQSFHADINPIRVSNARFSELLGESDEGEAVQLPLTPPDAPVAAGVTATSFQPGVTSPNVRYCDIVDNQRCPIIDHLDRNETAQVIARSSRSAGWFKIRLNSGHEGWIAASVVIVDGDVSSLPTEAPPEPRPAAPVQQPPQAVQPILPPGQSPTYVTTAAYPNGISIQGGEAFCNRPFNVQINITNPTNAVASGGQVSLQDVNLGTGEITASGYGSFPNLNPGANYVVVIPISTSVYYGETHELRARAAGRDVRLQYNLRQGDCNRGSGDNDDNDDGGSAANTPISCTLTSNTGRFEVYASPSGGEPRIVELGQLLANDKRVVGVETWYQVPGENAAQWILITPQISTSGSC